MALLSFVESAPRAYRLKASNAASPISTSSGTIPTDSGHAVCGRPMPISIAGSAILHQAHRYENGLDIGSIAGRNSKDVIRLGWKGKMLNCTSYSD
jgi:hypothetical protein